VSTTETRWGEGVNAEAIQAWDGPLFDRFVQYRDILVAGLGAHGDEALRLNPPQEGQRILDIGCGFGDTTQQIAALVGPSGEAVGVDAAKNFIDASIVEAQEAGVENARFFVADVQMDDLGGPYDAAFSRMGTMFFISPVAALRNVRKSLVPGGRLTMVVWRRREDNEWLYKAQQVVEGIVQRPDEYDEPTCGPGPFSMANADTVTDQLIAAGFEDMSLRRCDLPIKGGNSIDQALEIVMSIGPAGEILRLLGDRAAPYMPKVDAALRDAFKEFQREDGSIWGMASTWIVTATAPAEPTR
jgi:SAM-dependent methyltransferase